MKPPLAVYFVNTLVSTRADIRVTGQQRAMDQSSYGLSFVVGAVPRATGDLQPLAVFATFFLRGVHHILTGYDHLLFVGALVLGAATLWDLVKVVTAFTVAHSVTLSLATFVLVHLPSMIVEPMISASIVFVAAQNLLWPSQTRSSGRLAVAFVFGLFHGLGFAGGLLDMMHGMNPAVIGLALLGFSLGVEVGNQFVLLPLFIGLKAVRRVQDAGLAPGRTSATLARLGSAAICVAGAFYLGAAFTAS
ncbi:MAG: HupE/UreJ family protein [Caulobacteraceae bacterium]